MMRRWIDRAQLRLRSLFRAGAADAALRREIQAHLDEEIAANEAAGMSPADARAAALRAFGSIALIEEQCRDTRRVSFFHNVVQDLRYTLRSLRQQPLLVLAATLSIALAVGANTTIFSLAYQLLLAAPTANRPDRLVNIRMGTGSHVSYRQWRDLQQSGALAGLAGYQIEIEANWRGPERSITMTPLAVTANFFDVLGVPVALGRGFTAAEAAAERTPRVAVVSHAFWVNRLARDADAIGRSIIVNGDAYTVVGVLPEKLRAFPGYGISPEIYLPISPALMPGMMNVADATVQLVGRLHDGQTLGQARAALSVTAERLSAEYGERFAQLQQFSPVGGFGQAADFKSIGAFVLVLLVAVGLVLAVACANVAGLLLARGTVRRREIAIRVALGASRARLVQQLLTEGLWLAIFGTVGGLLLMSVLGDVLSSVSLPIPLPIEVHTTIDGQLLAYSMLLLIATTILCGLAPALQATRPSLVPAIKQDEPQYIHRCWTLRGMLVIGQVTVAVILLLTALLFVRNLTRATTADPGFDVGRALVAQVSFVEGRYTAATRMAFLDGAVARLRALPGVEHAAYSTDLPLTMHSGMTTGTELRTAENPAEFVARYEVNRVGAGYFDAMGIRVERGRDFRATDGPGTPHVAVINREFARRYLPGVDPIGLHLMLPGAGQTYPAEIVGVVGNSKHRTIGEDQQAAIYETVRQRSGQSRLVHFIVRTSGDPAASVRDVQTVLAQLDPTAAVDVQTMESTLAFAFMPSQIGAALLGALGALGLALAMVGLFAVMSYSVSRRTAEIGIRMALGASHRAVLRLVLGDAAVLAAVGTAIGLIVAAFITQPLAMFLVAGLSARDPLTFAGTAALLGAVSLAAAWIPARRALRVDAAAALRNV
jgi:predicted permease